MGVLWKDGPVRQDVCKDRLLEDDGWKARLDQKLDSKSKPGVVWNNERFQAVIWKYMSKKGRRFS